MNHRNTKSLVKAVSVGGTLLALLIGCSTQVEGVDDGALGTTQQALQNDLCLTNPSDPSCDTYDPSPPSPTTSTTSWSINTTYWRLDWAGWQLTVNPPRPVGTAATQTDDHIVASMSLNRTTAAVDTNIAFGAAIVRAIPRPIAGGTTSTSCTKNADCYSDGRPRMFGSGDPDGPPGGFNYCAKVGTNANKTCVQRAGGYAGPFQTTSSKSWQNVRIPGVNESSWTSTGTRSYDVPHSNGAPYGEVTTAPSTYGGSSGTDQYTLLAEVNVGKNVSYTDIDGVAHPNEAPCKAYKATTDPNHPTAYAEDPAYCARIVRPFVTLTKWKCGDGTCNGAETYSTCASDCLCGNGVCGAGEDYNNCPADCCSISRTWCIRYGIDDPECMACM